MIFLSPFLNVTRMSMSSFFPGTARHWNSVPLECFSLTYDLSGFKSRINRHLVNRFPICCNLFVLLFLVTLFLVVAVRPCMEWITIKKKKRSCCWNITCLDVYLAMLFLLSSCYSLLLSNQNQSACYSISQQVYDKQRKSFLRGDLYVCCIKSCSKIVLSQDFFMPAKLSLLPTMVVTLGRP